MSQPNDGGGGQRVYIPPANSNGLRDGFMIGLIGAQQAATLSIAAEVDAAGVAGVAEIGAIELGTFALAGVDLPATVAVGLLLMVVWFFADVLFKPIGDALGHVPLVGSFLHDVFYNIAGAVQNITNAILGFAVTPIRDLFVFIWQWFFVTPFATARAIQALSGYVEWQTKAAQPAENSYLQGQIDANKHQAAADTQAAQNLVTQYTNDVYHQVESDINTAVMHEGQALTDAFNKAEADIQAAQHLVTQYATDIYKQVEHDIGDAVQKVELELGHAEAAGQAYTDQQVHGLDQTLQATIGVTAATALATATQGQNAFKQYLDNCGTDVCKAQGKNSKNVNNLATDIGAAALFAFVAACIKEPNPMADASYTILSPVIGWAGGTADALLGAAVA